MTILGAVLEEGKGVAAMGLKSYGCARQVVAHQRANNILNDWAVDGMAHR
jgi:hypothetical protein